jgi:hypothetical protein
VEAAVDWVVQHPLHQIGPSETTSSLGLVGASEVVGVVLVLRIYSPLPPTVPAAETVLRHLDRLQRALVAYRTAALIPPLPPPPPDPDDIPF